MINAFPVPCSLLSTVGSHGMTRLFRMCGSEGVGPWCSAGEDAAFPGRTEGRRWRGAADRGGNPGAAPGAACGSAGRDGDQLHGCRRGG